MPDRIRAYRFGHAAEWVCAAWLALRGYEILARRFKMGAGEVDLIARRKDALAFIEVKARKEAAPDTIVTARQRRRIERAARCYLAGKPKLSGHSARFDVIIVRPWAWPRHIENAWQAQEER